MGLERRDVDGLKKPEMNQSRFPRLIQVESNESTSSRKKAFWTSFSFGIVLLAIKRTFRRDNGIALKGD
jgi:hypothetical protein